MAGISKDEELADYEDAPQEEDQKNPTHRWRSRSPKKEQKERPVAIVIRPGIPLKEFKLGKGVKFVSVKFTQRHLQGYLEALKHYEANLDGYHVYCDEEGRLKDTQKVNVGAARYCNCKSLRDQVVGTVVIVDKKFDSHEDDEAYNDPNNVSKKALELAEREFKEGLVLE
jgi:hypothetical protein